MLYRSAKLRTASELILLQLTASNALSKSVKLLNIRMMMIVIVNADNDEVTLIFVGKSPRFFYSQGPVHLCVCVCDTVCVSVCLSACYVRSYRSVSW